VDPDHYLEGQPEHWIEEGTVVRSEVIHVKVNDYREAKEVVLDLREWLQHPRELLGQVKREEGGEREDRRGEVNSYTSR
jgi:hypothetical protein